MVGMLWSASVSPAAVAERKSIRLRTDTLVTTPASRVAPAARLPEVSGLYLIQFDQLPDQVARERLAEAGVRLLRYVPEDAFVVRLHQADLGGIRGMAGVRWVGEYRPEYKLTAGLRALAAQGKPLDIRMAVAPDVDPVERLALRRAWQRVERESHSGFGTILGGRITPSQLAVLAHSPAVLWMERAPEIRLVDEISAKIVGGGDYETGEPGDGFPGLPWDDGEDDGFSVNSEGGARGLLSNLWPPVGNRTTVHQLGFDGTGVRVAVVDSGLHNGDAASMHPDLFGRVTAFFHYGGLTDAADEHSHGTHVAGIVAGNGATGETDIYGNLYGLGMAPGAEIVAQRIFDGIGFYEPPPTFEVLTRDAVRSGADIGSNSWGDDAQAQYDLAAAEFDALVRDADALSAGDQPFILEFSAGNSGPGPQTIYSPAVAKNVIATGASQNDRYGYFMFEDGPEAMADFSSRGPTADGRIKPDVVAPGTWIASLQSASATDQNAWLPISPNYQFQGGTSHSGPHASGAAAIFVQYWRETRSGLTPSPALVKAALIHSAVDLDDELGGTGPVPNMDEGWGRIDLTRLIGSDRGFEFVDQSVLLAHGQVQEHRLLVGDSRFPLKVTLTYTDVPALPAAALALVNNLDLEVEDPFGTVYRGNAFDQGQSIPHALASDDINNVEGVLILEPVPGEYILRVRAVRVVEDVLRRAGVEPVQDYALVASADVRVPGHGIVALDRAAYRAPGMAGVRLIDFDLRGLTEVGVRVTSDTESLGEDLMLRAMGTVGVFTGAVALATGPALEDGVVQVAHGDELRVMYEDANPMGVREGSAVVDLVAPVLTEMGVSSRFGRVEVTWVTDEAADAIVDYGPTEALGSSVTNLVRRQVHGVILDNVVGGQPVHFRLRSRDGAGNEGLLDDGGRPYQVVPEPAAPILLVNHFDDFLLESLSLAGYTDALDGLSIDYEIWDVAWEGRTPTLAELRNYRAVLWRVSEFFPALGAAEVRAIRDYLDAGGGFFLASMEVLSRLDESGLEGFRRNVLRVDTYEVDPGLGGFYGRDHLSLTSGVEAPVDFSEYPDFIIIPQDLSDTFRPTAEGEVLFYDTDTGNAVGVRHPRSGAEAPGRMVFLSFPFDVIPMDGESPNNRVDILRRVLTFLAPGVLPDASLELDREAYAFPGTVTAVVTDLARRGQEQVVLEVRTDGEAEDQVVVLAQVPSRPGLFRGTFRLAASGAVASPGIVPVADGDRLEATYRPSGAGAVVVAADMDSVSPEIGEIEIVPDYNDAVVRWTTSEPADSLVRYGRVEFPVNFTVFQASYVEVHELQMVGLEPDREYAVEIVSRDPAGNARTAPEPGTTLRFRTLKPLTPPFEDNLETGAPDWTVAENPLEQELQFLLAISRWELGQPNNALTNIAYSGTTVWGTNLRGLPNDYSETSLVSPALALAPGTRATLRFQHLYDFLPRSEEGDIFEFGGVYATTNNGAVWTPLASYTEQSDGWEEEVIDLGAFAGRVVRLGWAYGLFSIDAIEHPGWLIDDISVTQTTFHPGSLILRHNVHQAAVSLRGPINLIGRGREVVVSNAPPGEYRFEYGDVPWHLTPTQAPRTLAEGESVVVEANYVFPDVNANGLSDLWEERHFGALLSGTGLDTDADGDGMSDRFEFLAGTHPTNALSRLALEQPVLGPGTLTLQWTASPGHGYRVWSSTDALEWKLETDWIHTQTTLLSVPVPLAVGGPARLYRLEVEP